MSQDITPFETILGIFPLVLESVRLQTAQIHTRLLQRGVLA